MKSLGGDWVWVVWRCLECDYINTETYPPHHVEMYVRKLAKPIMGDCYECGNRSWTVETQGSPEGIPATWDEEPA